MIVDPDNVEFGWVIAKSHQGKVTRPRLVTHSDAMHWKRWCDQARDESLMFFSESCAWSAAASVVDITAATMNVFVIGCLHGEE
jgi:hypothetical protein